MQEDVKYNVYYEGRYFIVLLWEDRMRRPNPSRGPGVSVEVDWFGALPAAHLEIFRKYAEDFESSFAMFSVSLSEAIHLRDSGLLAISVEAVILTSALGARLAGSLENILVSMAQHSKEHGTVPNVALLTPAHFHSQHGQCSAQRSHSLNRLELSQGRQFLSKISAMKGIVANSGSNFRKAAEDLASHDHTVAPSASLWASLEEEHFDLNTCLRESMVLLKCFLRVLRQEELLLFEKTVSMREIGSGTSPGNSEAVWRRIPIPH